MALITALILLLTAIIILYHFSQRSLLYQSAFVYQANVLNISTIAPFSVLSTLIAVGVGLWWAAIDSTFRRLQPYLTMANAPTRLYSGASLSYQSSYWVWATTKALSNKHWLLCLVTLGTSLSPVCKFYQPYLVFLPSSSFGKVTIAMSALFRPTQGVIPETSTIERSLYIRQTPLLYQDVPWATTPGTSRQYFNYIISSLYSNLSTNWMYTAAIQLALNGSEPIWSHDGWSFVPINLSLAESKSTIQNVGNASFAPRKNVSLSTPAIRARLECTPYSDMTNTSDWLTTLDLSNNSIWNASTRPPDVTTGYQLGAGGSSGSGYFVDTNVLGTATYLACCANGSSQSTEDRSAVGYWSQTDPFNREHPVRWQSKLTVKWIYGKLLSGFRYVNSSNNVTLFTEVPRTQALHCSPVIETATSNLTVDQRTGRVQSFKIIDEPRSALEAYEDLYVAQGSGATGLPFRPYFEDFSVR